MSVSPAGTDGTPYGRVSLAGIVVGPGERPIVGAVLTLTDLSGNQLARAISSGDGSYQLSAAAAEAAMLVCATPAHGPKVSLIDLSASRTDFEIRLTGSCLLEGRVRDETSGEGVARALVTMLDTSGDVSATVLTDETGTYRIEELTEGDYTLAVAAPGFVPVAMTVAVDGSRTGVDLTVSGRITISGAVLQLATGAKVAEAVVTLLDPQGEIIGSTTTDLSGEYVLEKVVPGKHRLVVAGYQPGAVAVHSLAGETVVADLELLPAEPAVASRDEVVRR